MRMGGLVETALLDAAEALEARDEDLAEQGARRRRPSTSWKTRSTTEAARLIALRAPTAVDLRTVLTVMKIAASLERVGDYAKNLAKRTGVLGQHAAVPGAAGAIRRMAKAVVQMLDDALDAYIRRDAELADDVRMRDREIDQMYNSLFREFLTHMMEDPRNISALHAPAFHRQEHRAGGRPCHRHRRTGDLPGQRSHARGRRGRRSTAPATLRRGRL